MITEVSPSANVVLNGSGSGQCAIGPPSGTKWSLRLATTSVSATGSNMQVSLYRGSASGPLELVDSTNLGFASSGKVAGPVFFPGQRLWAVCTGGGANATLTLQAYGQQGSRSDPFELSPLGEGYPQQTTSLTIPTGATTGPRIVIGNDIPAVLAAWALANAVTITAVIVKYWNNTEFEWEAVGGFGGLNSTFNGTYDATNGVYLTNRIIAGAGGVTYNIGSATLNSSSMTIQMLEARILAQAANSAAWDDLSAIQPGTVATPETWNSLTLQNLFTNRVGAFPPGSYRMIASPPRSVEIKGQIVSGTTTASGTQIATLPVAYRPVSEQTFWGQNLSTLAPILVAVETTGMISLSGTWANGNIIVINGFIALDL